MVRSWLLCFSRPEKIVEAFSSLLMSLFYFICFAVIEYVVCWRLLFFHLSKKERLKLRKHGFQLEQIQNMLLEGYRKFLQHGCRVDAFKMRLISTDVTLALCVRGRKK